jgi:aminopeptidase YwaD
MTRVIRRLSRALAALALLLAVPVSGAEISPPAAWELRAEIERLTAPAMDGRATGTPGGDLAARTLADDLRAASVGALGDDGFFQSFSVRADRRLAPDNELSVPCASARALAVGRDWMPHGGSPEGDVTARLAFAGHGMAEASRDDYGSLDVRGRLVLVLGGPLAVGGTRLEKLLAARRHGAAGVLVVDERLPALDATAVSVGLPSATLTAAAADALLAGAGTTLARLRAPSGDGRPAAALIDTEVHLRVRLQHEQRRGANVIGVLPGTDPTLARDAIVIGAHYDHLGRAGDGAVHPGADDNASGTALVVGLARAFARAGGAPRTLVFALFGGEELGLLGSARYVQQPVWPLERTVAMINLDMVGRLGDQTLRVGGVDSGDRLRALVTDAARAEGLALTVSGGPFEGSDHLSFYRAGVPVVFFTTGPHGDYHLPSDTVDKIDASGMARIARVAARVATALAAGPRPAFVKLAPPEPRRPAGPLLGIMADQGAGADGVRIAAVMADSAADRAGIVQGDVIYRFEGAAVQTFEALRRLIRARRPGDRVEFDYVRGGEAHHGSVVLGGTAERATDG